MGISQAIGIPRFKRDRGFGDLSGRPMARERSNGRLDFKLTASARLPQGAERETFELAVAAAGGFGTDLGVDAVPREQDREPQRGQPDADLVGAVVGASMKFFRQDGRIGSLVVGDAALVPIGDVAIFRVDDGDPEPDEGAFGPADGDPEIAVFAGDGNEGLGAVLFHEEIDEGVSELQQGGHGVHGRGAGAGAGPFGGLGAALNGLFLAFADLHYADFFKDVEQIDGGRAGSEVVHLEQAREVGREPVGGEIASLLGKKLFADQLHGQIIGLGRENR